MQHQSYPIVFTGNAETYRVVWRRNLCLLAVSLLFAWPWTYVRKLQYLYSHTSIAGHAFSYHADPKKIFISNLWGIFFIEALYYGIYKSGVYAWTLLGLVQIVFAALLPFVLHKNLAFRLRHTEWMGRRFHLNAKPADAWHAMCVPTFLYIVSGVLLVLCVLEGLAERYPLAWTFGVSSLAGFCFSLALLYVQFNRYRQRYAAWGDLRNEAPLNGRLDLNVRLVNRAAARAFVACLCLGVTVTCLMRWSTGWPILETGAALRSHWWASGALLILFVPGLYCAICGVLAVAYPYLGTHLQNQCWSGVKNKSLSLHSEVQVDVLVSRSWRNWLRVWATAGRHYPQTFMEEVQMRLGGMAVRIDAKLLRVQERALRDAQAVSLQANAGAVKKEKGASAAMPV